MKRVFCLLAVFGIAGAALAGDGLGDPHGDPCPFGFTDPQLSFDETHGSLDLEPFFSNVSNISAGPLPCGYSAVIDGETASWVGVEVRSIPRQLTVSVALNLEGVVLAPEESLQLLELFTLPAASSLPNAAASVWVNGEKIILTWWNGSTLQSVARPIPGSRFTLVLAVDRGRPVAGGSLSLSVAGSGDAPLTLGPIDLDAALPLSGRHAMVRFGVLGLAATGTSGIPVAPRGNLGFRPISVEMGWGRPPS